MERRGWGTRHCAVQFDVIQRRVLLSIRNALDANLISRLKPQPRNPMPGGRVAARFGGGKMIVCHPLIYLFIAHPDAKFRCAVVLIEILHIYFILPWHPVETECSRAS